MKNINTEKSMSKKAIEQRYKKIKFSRDGILNSMADGQLKKKILMLLEDLMAERLRMRWALVNARHILRVENLLESWPENIKKIDEIISTVEEYETANANQPINWEERFINLSKKYDALLKPVSVSLLTVAHKVAVQNDCLLTDKDLIRTTYYSDAKRYLDAARVKYVD